MADIGGLSAIIGIDYGSKDGYSAPITSESKKKGHESRNSSRGILEI